MYLPSALLFFCFLWSTLVSAWEPPTVYLIRHGEKPDDPKDPRLTKDGLKRAQCLRTVFGAESGYNISYIIAPKVKKHHLRAYETVHPLAEDLGLEIDTHCSRKKAKCVAKTIRKYDGPGNILVSWRHGTFTDIEKYLGVKDVLEYPDDRFDLIWTLPWPYDTVTDIKSEDCPDLDASVSPGLVAQHY
ncbi:uncharacterized protein N7469_008417 [Penicillium citrinum]|uniref:Phosphoglycerate mutase family protein n=2 Tax=Penicillium TaxID=5073 RepID=A0A9W9TJJ9_PENCI|nr:uncharacterized protein N7469_008417 [Penicillium citrinum]KAJ5224914.1 hypothetical protein N7469_008417 [Penicillium citrinum]KAJ5575171.1 hypothetical protein N7450_009070 [Penicillium hetheringtonii]